MGSLATGEEHLCLCSSVRITQDVFPLNVEQLKPRVTFGGSYPGSLSAWMRLRFPHLVSGSVSSSGPLWAKLDFFEYLQVKSVSSYALSTLFARWSWTRWTQLDLGATLLLLRPSPQLRPWWLIIYSSSSVGLRS